ncbi:TRAP transporter small permease [Agrobacterium vitis]|uniref:TRAP transporter small permease protein n=1 Tax=Agrobacterium vitis TaxID=373 RepID=A0AAE2UP83_AGRVI|nr:TRAP transporter small permease [Agrobacterium vitis]MBF2713192.1 TRAP transporter small permease [Agrobacterium vitis]
MSRVRPIAEMQGDPLPLRLSRVLRLCVKGLATFMAYAAGWNYIACAAFITADIVGRTLFGFSSAATVEVTSYMLAAGLSWSLAHTLAMRAHIRVDVLINRMPLSVRAIFHVVSILMLAVFSGFVAWSGWSLVEESLLFQAHDNSALHIPMWIPQGIWFAGLLGFFAMALALSLESILALASGHLDEVEALLSSRSVDDETEEALEAVGMTAREHVQ